jgi:hypothetical protein
MKQDQRRISKEKHEIAYCRMLAREEIKAESATGRSIRIAKALLKFTRGYSKKK